MLNILLWLFLPYLLAQASDTHVTDILLNRQATYEERDAVAKILSTHGKEAPLETHDAIAELCYNIDLCAQLTADEQYPAECSNPETEEDAFCYSKYFRKTYSCNENLEKQSNRYVLLGKTLLVDLASTYRSYIHDFMIDAFSKQYGVNFREFEDDEEARENFFKANPHVKERVLSMSRDSLALSAYTLNCYHEVNQILYREEKAKMIRYYKLINAVINTMSFFPVHKGLVNRGVKLPPEVLKQHHVPGNIVCYNGFTSTAVHDPKTDRTNKPRNYFLSSKCTQRFFIKYDESARAGVNISNGSSLRGEKEVLFEPGACFRIDAVHPRIDIPEDDTDGACAEGEHYNFEMTLVR